MGAFIAVLGGERYLPTHPAPMTVPYLDHRPSSDASPNSVNPTKFAMYLGISVLLSQPSSPSGR